MNKKNSKEKKNNSEKITEECIKLNNRTYELLSSQISAIDNKVRFSIMSILSDIEHVDKKDKQNFLYSREINNILCEYFDIDISIQMLGQHLKQLENAGWIKSAMIKKEVPNKIGLRTVKAYGICNDVIKDLFLDMNFLTNELLSLYKAHEKHLSNIEEGYCTLTLLNGENKYESYKISKEEILLIGKEDDGLKENPDYKYFILDKYYTKVSSIYKSPIKIFYENDYWCILDEESEHRTFIGEKPVLHKKTTHLRNKSFLRLSRGPGAAVFYCTF